MSPSSIRARGRSKHDFAHIDVVRLADRVGDGRGHSLGADRDGLVLTLRAFSTYLPPSFVRGFDGGRPPVPGVRREPVILMFTDIEGFTGISEAMAPEDLMPQVSRYFAEISDEILSCGGTLAYGTRVLVSGTLREATGREIRFRHVDDVCVRGTQDRIDVNELAGSAPRRRGAYSRGRPSPDVSPT